MRIGGEGGGTRSVCTGHGLRPRGLKEPPVSYQLTRLPSLSYLRPLSSKAWVISWPVTAPMAAKFTASSASTLKKGGWRIAAGKTISLNSG